MSFRCHAKRARNPETPFGMRVSSVRSCVERYHPLGFHATLAFLESRSGRLRRDEQSMLAALDLLEHSRAVWRREKEKFAVARRIEKAAGRRTLPATVRNAYRCDRWHAAPRTGAMFAVGYWWRVQRPALQGDDPLLPPVDALVESCLGEELDSAFVVRLAALRLDLRNGLNRQDDQVGYFRRREMLRTLHHISIAVECSAAADSAD